MNYFRKMEIGVRKLKDTLLKLILGNLGYWKKKGLNIGTNVNVGGGTSFGAEPYLVTINDNVLISSNVQFITHDGSVHTIVSDKRFDGLSIHKYGKIIVGPNSFIGANCIVLPNVRIGRNCVIGAGSVVTKSIPDNSVAAGNPARVITDFESYANKTVKKMNPEWDREQYITRRKDYLIEVIPDPQ